MVTAAALNSVHNPVIIPAVTGNEAIFFHVSSLSMSMCRIGRRCNSEVRKTNDYVRSKFCPIQLNNKLYCHRVITALLTWSRTCLSTF